MTRTGGAGRSRCCWPLAGTAVLLRARGGWRRRTASTGNVVNPSRQNGPVDGRCGGWVPRPQIPLPVAQCDPMNGYSVAVCVRDRGALLLGGVVSRLGAVTRGLGRAHDRLPIAGDLVVPSGRGACDIGAPWAWCVPALARIVCGLRVTAVKVACLRSGRDVDKPMIAGHVALLRFGLSKGFEAQPRVHVESPAIRSCVTRQSAAAPLQTRRATPAGASVGGGALTPPGVARALLRCQWPNGAEPCRHACCADQAARWQILVPGRGCRRVHRPPAVTVGDL